MNDATGTPPPTAEYLTWAHETNDGLPPMTDEAVEAVSLTLACAAQEANAGELRSLLAAVLAALDIPHPATVGDSEQYHEILAERAMHARIALDGVLRGGDDPAWSTEYLRERLSEHPPTGYRAA